MMRLSSQTFRTEANWKDLMDRNEKLATEIGRLRGDVRSLRKKNSALLLWKLKVDPQSFAERPVLSDKSTQTESMNSLLDTSNIYQTPLRTRPVSRQNSVFHSSSSYYHNPSTISPLVVHEEDDNDAHHTMLLSVLDSLSPPQLSSVALEKTGATKLKSRRSSYMMKSRLESQNFSPKQQEVTQELAERVREEQQIQTHQLESLSTKFLSKLLQKEDIPNLFPSISPAASSFQTPARTTQSQQKSSTAATAHVRRDINKQVDSIKTPFESLATPDRPSRSVKKPVTYKEPSLRVKVRKGFKFFKFSDTPIPKSQTEVASEEGSQKNNEEEEDIALEETYTYFSPTSEHSSPLPPLAAAPLPTSQQRYAQQQSIDL